MAGKIAIEAIIYTLVYSLAMLMLFKVQGARRQLYNYPPAIQKQAIEKGITTQEEMNANAKKNKIVGILMMVVFSVFITCVVNRQFTFLDGFLQSYIFSMHFPCLMRW